MTVDSKCSVAISSPDQPQCSLLPTVESTIEETIDNTPAIIGGAMGVILIMITITLVLVIFMFLKYRPKGKVSLKKSGKKYVLV